MNPETIPIGRRAALAAFLFFFLLSSGWGTGWAADAPSTTGTGPEFVPRLAFFWHLDGTIFNDPMGIFWDARKREIYVADTKNNLIGIFDPTGASLYFFGADDDIKEPGKVLTDARGRIYVLDLDRSRIKIYDYRGEFLGFFAPPELKGDRTFTSIATDNGDNLYVGDSRSGQIFVFDPARTFRFRFGSRGDEPGQFQAIQSIAVGRDGKIYVTDAQVTAVQVFDRRGNFLRGWGKHEMGPYNFSLPAGIAVDSRGRILVVDTLRHDIKIFDGEGNFLDKFGGLGGTLGDITYPSDIAIDASDRIYVLEKGGRRVQVFDEKESDKKPFGK